MKRQGEELPDTSTKKAKWWEDDAKPEENNSGIRWKKMEHHGVTFAPEYEPHGVPLYVDDQAV